MLDKIMCKCDLWLYSLSKIEVNRTTKFAAAVILGASTCAATALVFGASPILVVSCAVVGAIIGLAAARFFFPPLPIIPALSPMQIRIISGETVGKDEIYNEFAITSENWAEWSKAPVDAEDARKARETLPETIADILAGDCPAFPGKKVIETHNLIWKPSFMTGNDGVKNLQAFALLHFPEISNSGFRRYFAAEEHRVSPGTGFFTFMTGCNRIGIEESGWFLMLNKELVDSKGKKFSEQDTMALELGENSSEKSSYRLPTTPEAIAGILAQYCKNKTRLYSESLVRCHDLKGCYTPLSVGFWGKNLPSVWSLDFRGEINVPSCVAPVRILT